MGKGLQEINGPAFWDSSSLVPLCVSLPSTPSVEALSKRYTIVVWWAARLELQSVFARLVKMRQLSPDGLEQAELVLDKLRRSWREVDPRSDLWDRAEPLVARFELTTADAFQLAAALTWCLGNPRGRAFISGHGRLLDAARAVGFDGIEG